jgi:predicted transcriptional regulator
MKYRDRTEIITVMLRSANNVNGTFKTRIMHEAFLSFSQLEEYFPLLLRNGLLWYDEIKKTYKITGKGLHVLELCDSLNQEIGIRKTNKDDKNTIKL